MLPSRLKVLAAGAGVEVGDVALDWRSASGGMAAVTDRYEILQQRLDDGGELVARQRLLRSLKILAGRRTGHGSGRIFPYGPFFDPPQSRTGRNPRLDRSGEERVNARCFQVDLPRLKRGPSSQFRSASA